MLTCDSYLSPGNGYVWAAENNFRESMAEAVEQVKKRGVVPIGSANFTAHHTGLSPVDGSGTPWQAYVFGCQVAEVEVDTVTGEVQVLGVWAAHDVGRAVNPENRSSDEPRRDDYLFEGFELDDALAAANDAAPANAGAAANDTVRREIKLTQGIPQEKAKAIVKAIKDKKFKKAQASIQGEEIRVQAPAKDELQEVIAFLRTQDFGLELRFGNYRG